MVVTGNKSQDFLPIKEIRDGVVILKDGSMRQVLIASSINFALKSPDEQTAIIIQYQNFLDSLDFDMQIFVQSRKLDIRPYLMTLEARLKEEGNDLIKIQIKEYIEFIRSFTESANIMTKAFFIVVPYTPPIFTKKAGFVGSILKRNKKPVEELANDFNEHKSQLQQRSSVIEEGLSRIGVRVVTLGTEELVELYFKIFNPGENDTPRLEVTAARTT